MKFKTRVKNAQSEHKLEVRRQKRIKVALGEDIDLVSFFNNRSGEKLELEDYEANHVFKERERVRERRKMKSSKFTRIDFQSEQGGFEISIEKSEGDIPSLPSVRVSLRKTGLKNDILIHNEEELTDLMTFLSDFAEEWRTLEAKKKQE